MPSPQQLLGQRRTLEALALAARIGAITASIFEYYCWPAPEHTESTRKISERKLDSLHDQGLLTYRRFNPAGRPSTSGTKFYGLTDAGSRYIKAAMPDLPVVRCRGVRPTNAPSHFVVAAMAFAAVLREGRRAMSDRELSTWTRKHRNSAIPDAIDEGLEYCSAKYVERTNKSGLVLACEGKAIAETLYGLHRYGDFVPVEIEIVSIRNHSGPSLTEMCNAIRPWLRADAEIQWTEVDLATSGYRVLRRESQMVPLVAPPLDQVLGRLMTVERNGTWDLQLTDSERWMGSWRLHTENRRRRLVVEGERTAGHRGAPAGLRLREAEYTLSFEESVAAGIHLVVTRWRNVLETIPLAPGTERWDFGS